MPTFQRIFMPDIMPDTPPSIFATGHFYSPVVDPSTLDHAHIWNNRSDLPGIDLRLQNHIDVLTKVFPRWIADYDYPDAGNPDTPAGFFNHNDQFSWLDARLLYVLMRELRPKRMLEIGSGFSTLLAADVVQRFVPECKLRCIEPYPRDFLVAGIAGVKEVIQQRAQAVEPSVFEALQAGDILFIDSSHVCKTGSDVNYLFFEILPRMKPGTYIHVHDIFLPDDYPKQWVIHDNRSWNEQYLLRALLMYSNRFEVYFGAAYAAAHLGSYVVQALTRPDGYGMGGGSFWIRVK